MQLLTGGTPVSSRAGPPPAGAELAMTSALDRRNPLSQIVLEVTFPHCTAPSSSMSLTPAARSLASSFGYGCRYASGISRFEK
jgi:hypothetical protein